MGKIIFVIPYPSMAELIVSMIQEQDDNTWEFETIISIGIQAIIGRDIKSDVIIARGVTAAALKHRLSDTQVVELPVSGYDIMHSVKECAVRFNDRKIGLVGSYHMLYGAKRIEKLMDVELSIVEVNDEDEAEPSILKLKQQGINTVIGGVVACKIAQRLGMNSLYVESGREAIYYALNEAKRVATIRRQEQERAEQFRAILDYSDEGIIAVDAKGEINLVNMAAIKITGLKYGAIGKKIKKALPQLDLGKVLISGRGEIGEIQLVNNHQVVINKVPIVIAGETSGAVITLKLVAEIRALEGKIREKIYRRGHIAKLQFSDIIGTAQIIKDTINIAREFGKVGSNVLIVGETGTGKEVFAQSIHNGSNRCKGPFVAVNCAALPENLLESELFGYTEGAFTGAARSGKIGLFELAHLGTIFLDEVSDIAPKLQGRLLRVLQEREIMRLGDDKVIPIDVRIIAATNKDLFQLMEEGVFREDLYYRLDILKLAIPPLRERGEDIMLLMNYFFKIYCVQFNKECKEISQAAQNKLMEHPWRGNVRELRNIAERLAVLSKGSILDLQEIEVALARPKGVQKSVVVKLKSSPLDKEYLIKVLEETDYHYGKAAAKLGISRTTLWKRLKEIGEDLIT